MNSRPNGNPFPSIVLLFVRSFCSSLLHLLSGSTANSVLTCQPAMRKRKLLAKKLPQSSPDEAAF
jgi:hypothetical protein